MGTNEEQEKEKEEEEEEEEDEEPYRIPGLESVVGCGIESDVHPNTLLTTLTLVDQLHIPSPKIGFS